MQPFFERDSLTLYCGDLRKVLPTLPEASVDFVVTDPPYGLSFMEKDWDHDVPGPEYWRAIARVCKPGALMLAFGGTRTYHRLICAIEDAGWEIRDCLMWLYGQGFPKAADVGKMIDKAKGAVREVVGTKLGQPGYSLADNGRTNEVYGDLHNPEAECAITAPATPEAARWTGWANALKPAWEPIVLAMKPVDGTLAHNAEKWGVAGMNIDAARIGENPGYRYNADHNGTTFHGKQGERIKQSAEKKGSQFIESNKGRWPANVVLDTDAAAQLDDQTGTLTSGSNNVRTKPGDGYHGGMGKAGDAQVAYGDSGGASRFFYTGKATTKERNKGCEKLVTWEDTDLSQETDELLQHAKAISAIGTCLLDDGEWNTMLSGSNITDQSRTAIAFITSTLTRLITELRTFNFSPSSNTNASILAATKMLLVAGLNLVAVADDIDRLRTSTSGTMASLLSAVSAASRVLARISAKGKRGNTHCTVKPVKLMEYLLTLLSTPDGGVILDPFAGSGTTLLAAQRLGRRCIGVELTEHNCEIARGRLHVG
jgi:site-specific DNA-methyltransferase (adenine-specific)